MVQAQAIETIRCRPDELLEFVLDPEQYAKVDAKIGTIDWVKREGDVAQFRFRGKLPGLPDPAPKLTSRMSLTPGERIDVRLPSTPDNRLINLMMKDFSASWVCEPVDGATKVTRALRFDFKPPAKWPAEPVLRRTLQRDVENELRGAEAYLENRRG